MKLPQLMLSVAALAVALAGDHALAADTAAPASTPSSDSATVTTKAGHPHAKRMHGRHRMNERGAQPPADKSK
ncbi:MAG: hypothetical protein U1F52_02670 [Burkholderiales bacterium]